MDPYYVHSYADDPGFQDYQTDTYGADYDYEYGEDGEYYDDGEYPLDDDLGFDFDENETLEELEARYHAILGKLTAAGLDINEIIGHDTEPGESNKEQDLQKLADFVEERVDVERPQSEDLVVDEVLAGMATSNPHAKAQRLKYRYSVMLADLIDQDKEFETSLRRSSSRNLLSRSHSKNNLLRSSSMARSLTRNPSKQQLLRARSRNVLAAAALELVQQDEVVAQEEALAAAPIPAEPLPLPDLWSSRKQNQFLIRPSQKEEDPNVKVNNTQDGKVVVTTTLKPKIAPRPGAPGGPQVIGVIQPSIQPKPIATHPQPTPQPTQSVQTFQTPKPNTPQPSSQPVSPRTQAITQPSQPVSPRLLHPVEVQASTNFVNARSRPNDAPQGSSFVTSRTGPSNAPFENAFLLSNDAKFVSTGDSINTQDPNTPSPSAETKPFMNSSTTREFEACISELNQLIVETDEVVKHQNSNANPAFSSPVRPPRPPATITGFAGRIDANPARPASPKPSRPSNHTLPPNTLDRPSGTSIFSTNEQPSRPSNTDIPLRAFQTDPGKVGRPAVSAPMRPSQELPMKAKSVVKK